MARAKAKAPAMLSGKKLAAEIKKIDGPRKAGEARYTDFLHDAVRMVSLLDKTHRAGGIAMGDFDKPSTLKTMSRYAYVAMQMQRAYNLAASERKARRKAA